MARGFFWLGTEPQDPSGPVGQMYVEWEAPDEEQQPYPVVLVHGGGGQGLDYLGTPDGRPGWAQLLVRAGYAVYVVDRPGHGRSPHHPDVLGPMAPQMPGDVWLDIMLPPVMAPLHSQWPGGRTMDDEVVRQAVAAGGPMLADWADMHTREQARMTELLDRIGPAIVICHSAGGPAGYLAADARPELVKALVAIETIGPPFLQRPGMHLDWGLTCAPLTFDPPADTADQLALVTDTTSGPVPRTLQQEPARRLRNLSTVPIAVVTGEASVFTAFDGHLVDFLTQAGCQVDRLRLGDHGVHGNGHMMMIEANNHEVLHVLVSWWEEQLLGAR